MVIMSVLFILMRIYCVKKNKTFFNNLFLVVCVLMLAYFLSYYIQFEFETDSLVPMVFVLGVFFIALRTEGYFWGVVSSLVGVMLVNFAFTAPFFQIDFITPVNLFAAAVMLVIAIVTSTLTTKIKQQEKIKMESEKERMRGNLLRAVSHDLRTPLTSIYGATSVIMENYDSLNKEKQMKLLGEIHADSQWLIRMVENLLSVTRIDDSITKISMVPVALDELIDSVIVKFNKHYPKQPVKVEVPDEFVSISMDAILIQQVLMNIMENAVFHAKGMTELILSVHIENSKAVFEVKDDGCGVPEEKLTQIFTGYLEREGNIPTDGSRNNMGIGLSVCSTIIKAHGGTIFAKNREEGGAIFGFKLDIEETYE